MYVSIKPDTIYRISRWLAAFICLALLAACSLFAPAGLIKKRTYSPLSEADSLYSDLPLGVTYSTGKTTFRLFAPHATRVSLVLLPTYDAMSGDEYPMARDRQGIWYLSLIGRLPGQVYGYRVWGPAGNEHMFDPGRIISDPYAVAVISQNNYLRNCRAMIPRDGFDWEDDTWINLEPRDAVIYELHVRDMTAHPTSESPRPGTYPGLVAEPQKGGITHVKELGINAIELLPIFDFGNIEIPYKDTTDGVYNDWNPYARNHWGYMPTHFFAPEAYYATGGNMIPDAWLGYTGHQVQEFKEMVKQLHQDGIAVILDVVYNHVSQYDLSPLKYIDRAYYFRLNQDGGFLNRSGSGNDLRTEAPMVRRLILDSILYWMQEFHIDGFRFDQAGLIDEETARLILQKARKLNPNVIIIAEPWGGAYSVAEQYADLDWAVWNDQFLHVIKGRDSYNDRGFIFGNWHSDNSLESLKRYLSGSPRSMGGQFLTTGQSVNYLASHDGYTLSDFIRLANGTLHPDSVITDLDAHATVTGKELAFHKLAALCLLTAQGAVMIHEGQDFARSKVIAHTDAPDVNAGHPDHHSSEKDNDTNYLNWDHKELNLDLFRYYQGLIKLRKTHRAFRHADPAGIQFFPGQTQFGLAMLLPKTHTGDTYDFLVLLNGSLAEAEEFALPDGQWSAVVTWNTSGIVPIVAGLTGVITVPPTAGMVLRR